MENNPRITRSILLGLSVLIVGAVLWNTYLFYNKLKENERDKMKIFAAALQENAETSEDELGQDLGLLALTIVQSNTSTPLVLYTHKDDSYIVSNIPNGEGLSQQDILDKVARYKQEYNPIPIRYEDQLLQTIYYGNSPLINKVKYYPAVILIVIILFVAFIYFFYRTSKASEQNKLWAGMAKETAHQIGTPLSSLVGWTEILKSEHVNPSYIAEIEKDITRLETITERFSKVGSKPSLQEADVVAQTKIAYDYLKARTSKLIKFSIELPEEKIYAKINEQLFSWTIENLVKNGIDAMKGKGDITVRVSKNSKYVNIWVTDTGKGIPKRNFKKIFSPGFTTKKRGWGLGLSLAKRIIEEYHNGHIHVLKSNANSGTTMEVQLRLV